ncbi:MAG: IS5 family transposase, partial [Rhodothermales bacterium]
GENLTRLTPEILDQISVAVVKAGHRVLNEDGESTKLECRVDSFVVETDVEYPTDTGLFAESLRKMIEILGKGGFPGWRQWQHHLRQVQTAKRNAQKARSSRSQDPSQREKGEQRVRDAYTDFLYIAVLIMQKVDETELPPEIAPTIAYFRGHAITQGKQIERRVFLGEKIPHTEKVFSIFEPYTRWIQKGKAGVPCELGLPVSIIEDEHGFILHHRIMLDTETDVEAAVPLVRDTTLLYQKLLKSCSFDRGFYSPANATDLPAYVRRSGVAEEGQTFRSEPSRRE